jgi:tetratricopeptide (TPR) repeat protein
MNKVRNSPDVGRSIKLKRLANKLSKIKRQINLEFENEALSELNLLFEGWRVGLDVQHGYEMADCFYKLRRYKSCLQVLEAIIPDENRKQPKIQNLKGQCLMKLGNLQGAIDLFEICIVMDPHFKVAYNNLGNIFKEKKDFEKCKTYYTKSKKCNVGSPSH